MSVLSYACAAFALAQLAPPPEPPENLRTPAKTLLGKALFWDEQLSSDNTMACGTCHRPRSGGADPRMTRLAGPDGVAGNADDVFGSAGVIAMDANGDFRPSATFGFGRQATGRFAQDFLGAAWSTTNFWDGRASTTFIDPQTGAKSIARGGALESQLVGPPVSNIEMAHAARTFDQIAAKLARVRPLALSPKLTSDLAAALATGRRYPDLFADAFGTSAVTSERIAFAIASYERSLVPDRTPWDLAQVGEPNALSPDERAGLAIFTNGVRCSICHPPPTFADDAFHNLGLRPPGEDLGRAKVTGDPADRGRFKTPSLRNAGLRGRFMHNGGLATLGEVIDFYDRGGGFPDNRDPLLRPLHLTLKEKGQLLAFLDHGLTDPRVAAEVAPFDRPMLRSESGPDPTIFGEPTLGSGGHAPTMIAASPPNLGNDAFQFGVSGALGGAQAFLLLSGETTDDAYEYAREFPVYVELALAPVIVPRLLLGAGDGGGYATVELPLPDDIALVGQRGYAQWLVLDPGAAGGVCVSEGACFTLF